MSLVTIFGSPKCKVFPFISSVNTTDFKSRIFTLNRAKSSALAKSITIRGLTDIRGRPSGFSHIAKTYFPYSNSAHVDCLVSISIQHVTMIPNFCIFYFTRGVIQWHANDPSTILCQMPFCHIASCTMKNKESSDNWRFAILSTVCGCYSGLFD